MPKRLYERGPLQKLTESVKRAMGDPDQAAADVRRQGAANESAKKESVRTKMPPKAAQR